MAESDKASGQGALLHIGLVNPEIPPNTGMWPGCVQLPAAA